MVSPLRGLNTEYKRVTRTPNSSSSSEDSLLIIEVMDFSPTTLASRALLLNRNLEYMELTVYSFNDMSAFMHRHGACQKHINAPNSASVIALEIILPAKKNIF